MWWLGLVAVGLGLEGVFLPVGLVRVSWSGDLSWALVEMSGMGLRSGLGGVVVALSGLPPPGWVSCSWPAVLAPGLDSTGTGSVLLAAATVLPGSSAYLPVASSRRERSRCAERGRAHSMYGRLSFSATSRSYDAHTGGGGSCISVGQSMGVDAVDYYNELMRWVRARGERPITVYTDASEPIDWPTEIQDAGSMKRLRGDKSWWAMPYL